MFEKFQPKSANVRNSKFPQQDPVLLKKMMNWLIIITWELNINEVNLLQKTKLSQKVTEKTKKTENVWKIYVEAKWSSDEKQLEKVL